MASQTTTWEDVTKTAKKLATNEKTRTDIRSNANVTSAELDKISASSKAQANNLYNQAKKTLSSSIKGGMSETTKSKLGVAYARAAATSAGAVSNAKAAVNANKEQTIANVKAKSHATIASTRSEIDQARRSRKDRITSERANRKQKLSMEKERKAMDKASKKVKKDYEKASRKLTNQKNELAVWKDTVIRYDTLEKAKKAIANLKKSKDPLKAQKIAYIRGQMYALNTKAQEEAMKKELEKAGGGGRGGGGGGGYRRYGGYRRWGYGSGGSNSGVIEYKGDKDSSLTKEMNTYRAQNYKKMPSRGGASKSKSTWQKIKGALTGPAKVNNKTKQVYKKVAKPTKQSKGSVARRNRSSQSRHWHL